MREFVQFNKQNFDQETRNIVFYFIVNGGIYHCINYILIRLLIQFITRDYGYKHFFLGVDISCISQ